ncbi:hypothetical protein E2562_005226, partial [Oryza meyeriana var. granulata]
MDGDPSCGGGNGFVDLMYQAIASVAVFHQLQASHRVCESSFLADVPGYMASLYDEHETDEQSINVAVLSSSESASSVRAETSNDSGRESTSGVPDEPLANIGSTGSSWVRSVECSGVRNREDEATRSFQPSRVCALKSTIKNFIEKKSDVVTEPTYGMACHLT